VGKKGLLVVRVAKVGLPAVVVAPVDRRVLPVAVVALVAKADHRAAAVVPVDRRGDLPAVAAVATADSSVLQPLTRGSIVPGLRCR
jgi:hypothetical protein